MTESIIRSVEDLNYWLNKRLRYINKTTDLRPYPLVLCHLDLRHRNIKLMPDGSMCILDWAIQAFSRDSTRLQLQHVLPIPMMTPFQQSSFKLLQE